MSEKEREKGQDILDRVRRMHDGRVKRSIGHCAKGRRARAEDTGDATEQHAMGNWTFFVEYS